MTTTSTAGCYASAASRRRSPAAANPTASGLGTVRWVVERTLAWLHSIRRLRIRYERSGEVHTAFLTLGASIICRRLLAA